MGARKRPFANMSKNPSSFSDRDSYLQARGHKDHQNRSYAQRGGPFRDHRPQQAQTEKVWRPRENVYITPKTTSLPQGDIRLHVGRTLEFPELPPNAPKSRDEILAEIREANAQYIACSDPTESVVRRMRVLQHEAKGLVVETAERLAANQASQVVNNDSIVEQNLDASQAPTQLITEQVDQTLATQNTTTEAPKRKRGRPPISSHLGPLNAVDGPSVPAKRQKPRRVIRSPKLLPQRQT